MGSSTFGFGGSHVTPRRETCQVCHAGGRGGVFVPRARAATVERGRTKRNTRAGLMRYLACVGTDTASR